AVAKHDDAVGAADRHLCRNLKRRSHGLGENGDVIGQRVGQRVPGAVRYGDQVGERALGIQDADHRAVWAVRIQSPAAGVTRPARAVNLTNDTPASKRTGLCDADKLVAEYAAESHVSFDQLEVGLTDARATHAHQHFPVTRIGRWPGFLNRYTLIEHQRTHLRNLSEQTAS